MAWYRGKMMNVSATATHRSSVVSLLESWQGEVARGWEAMAGADTRTTARRRTIELEQANDDSNNSVVKKLKL
jgi:hypothetical protein